MNLIAEAGVGRGLLAEQTRVASSWFLLGLDLRDLPLYYCQPIPDTCQLSFQGAAVGGGGEIGSVGHSSRRNRNARFGPNSLGG